MDFTWTPEQLELREAVVEFAQKALQDDLSARDHASEFSRDLWSRCAEFGIVAMPFPVEHGGGGLGILDTVAAMEALGYGCRDAGLVFGLNAQMWSVQMPIHHHGTPDQKERWLRPLCEGAIIGAHGMSEPGSGSDAFGLRTRAQRDGDHYVLNGSKTFVTNAPVADVYVVFATVDPGLGALGITGFLIPRDTPGLHVGNPIEKMGLRTSPMSELMFDDCRVPVDSRLGREGRGAMIFNDSMEWERTCILACAIGAMDRLLEEAIDYTRQRKQFGKPISQFQLVASRLVDIKLRTEAARLMLYKAVVQKESGQDASLTSAMAKLLVSEAYVQSAMDAVRVRGGYGYMTEYDVERELRDSVGGLLYSGTSEIQRVIIAQALGLG